MQDLLELIQAYGTLIYVLLFAYCMLKSGILPLFAGYGAQVGALDISIVAAVTLAGGYLGDEARFYIARQHGTEFLNKRPRLARLANKASAMLERYGPAYIFIYRYPKGLRTVGALPVGLTQISWGKFTLLNFASALLWVTLLVGGGYAFGALIEQSIAATWAAFSIIALLVFVAIVIFMFSRMAKMETQATSKDA